MMTWQCKYYWISKFFVTHRIQKGVWSLLIFLLEPLKLWASENRDLYWTTGVRKVYQLFLRQIWARYNNSHLFAHDFVGWQLGLKSLSNPVSAPRGVSWAHSRVQLHLAAGCQRWRPRPPSTHPSSSRRLTCTCSQDSSILGPILRTSAVLIPPHSISQSRSRGQHRFKMWENKLHCLLRVVTENLWLVLINARRFSKSFD